MVKIEKLTLCQFDNAKADSFSRGSSMRYRISVGLMVKLIDHAGGCVSSVQLLRKLNGLACYSDSVLHYADLPFAAECAFRGGHPRLILNGSEQLVMVVEVDSQRKLSSKELRALRDDFEGQLTDGIGAGCFDELTEATGLRFEWLTSGESNCTQIEGMAWRPKTTTARGNEIRISGAAKIIEKIDSAPPKPIKSEKAKNAGDRGMVHRAESTRPDFKKLFRLLAKPERDKLIKEIKTELQACGNDLSMVKDGEYPHGNIYEPKLLRLLLDAGLSPETIDANGSSLLVQVAGHPKCLEILLKENVDVNRVCDCTFASTALIRAARLGKYKSVKLLLDHGADTTIRDKSGKSVQDLVDKYSRDRQKILDILLA